MRRLLVSKYLSGGCDSHRWSYWQEEFSEPRSQRAATRRVYH
jgi:hypothetical protein